MKFSRFEEILAWQKAKSLCMEVYRIFESHQDFRFRNQVQSAAVSIMNNIAEGFERRSNNEFRQFLYIAKGSCGEVRSMIILAKELQKISEDQCEELITRAEEVSKMLSGLIKKL